MDAVDSNGERGAMNSATNPAGGVHRVGRFWRRLRNRLGTAGLTGIVLLALAATAAAYAPLLQSEAETMRADVEALQTDLRSAQRTTRPADRSQVEALRALLPPLESGTRDLRAVFAAAGRHRVDLPKGDYTLHRSEDGSDLARMDVVLPIKDRYVTIKALVADLLNELPHASLSELKLERSAASSNVLEARIRLTLHYRER